MSSFSALRLPVLVWISLFRVTPGSSRHSQRAISAGMAHTGRNFGHDRVKTGGQCRNPYLFDQNEGIACGDYGRTADALPRRQISQFCRLNRAPSKRRLRNEIGSTAWRPFQTILWNLILVSAWEGRLRKLSGMPLLTRKSLGWEWRFSRHSGWTNSTYSSCRMTFGQDYPSILRRILAPS